MRITKKILTKVLKILALMFVMTQTYSQGRPIPIANPLDANFNLQAGITSFTRVDYARILIPNPKPRVEGSIYAFKNWKNKGFFKIGDELYRVKNLNFNIWSNSIETKTSKDSVYVFDLKNVDYAYINNKKFKNYEVENVNQILQVMYEGDDFEILKSYKIEIRRKDASTDPLLVKKYNSVFTKFNHYWIKKGDTFEKVFMNRKKVLELFPENKDLILKYVKEKKLSFRKSEDIQKILNFTKLI